MAISFRKITKDNFKECIGLKVRDDQPFVAPNVYSIAQSKIESKYIPLAIYDDETIVGFIMYSVEHQNKELYLCRFMIDQRYQHRGYGRASLEILKHIAMQDPVINRIELSTKADNIDGIRMYKKFGFKDAGYQEHGEEVFILDLKNKE